jgi:hypothetical protein
MHRKVCGQKQTWPLTTIPASAWQDWVKPQEFWSSYPVSGKNLNPERLKYKVQIHKIWFYVFRHIPQYIYNHILLTTSAYFRLFQKLKYNTSNVCVVLPGFWFLSFFYYSKHNTKSLKEIQFLRHTILFRIPEGRWNPQTQKYWHHQASYNAVQHSMPYNSIHSKLYILFL